MIAGLGGNLSMASGKMPVAGDVAPEFELPDSTQTPRRLSDLVSRGHVVLLFYRGDW
jgi:peroxiredoxin